MRILLVAAERLLALPLALMLLAPTASALGLPIALAHDGPHDHEVPTRAAATPAAGGANATDPEGDAVEWTPEAGAEAAHDLACHAYSNGTIHEQCDRATGQAPELDAAGTPAPPSLDIVSLGFTERADAVIAEIRVASLDEALTGLAPDASTGTAFFLWYPDPVPGSYYENIPERFVMLHFPPEADPYAIIEGTCWGCEWRIPFELVYGSPGSLRLTIPRDLLPSAERGDVLDMPHAYSVRATSPPATSWRVITDHADEGGTIGPSASQISDEIRSPAPFRFALEKAPFDLAREAREWPVEGPTIVTRPDVPLPPTQTLRLVRLIDTPLEVGVALQLEEARLNGTTVRVDMIVGDAFFSMGVDGTAQPHIMRSAIVFADEGRYASASPIEVTLTEAPGPLGWINVTWAREDLRSPPAGTLVGYTAVRLGAVGGASVAGNEIIVHNRQLPSPGNPDANYAIYGPFDVYHLRNDTVIPAMRPVATFVKDALGDVTLPPLANTAGAAYKDHVDITFLEVKGIAPGQSRVTLGVRDLSRVTVPAGFRAVAYAAAVDTPGGPAMVVYYKSSEQDGGRQEFFCAPDNAVLAEERANPYDAVRIAIEGLVVGSSPTGGGESDAIVFTVPHACLGADAAAQLSGSRLAAATFLVARAAAPGASDVEMLDEVRADEPVILGAAPPLPARAPWYDAPLGVREFWNILGVAVALAGGGAALAGRHYRRQVLQRELKAVDAEHARERADPARWKRAMAARRTHAGELLRRRRLRPDEVLVIERRIELLSSDVAEAPAVLPVVAAGALLFDRYRIERLLGEGGQGRAFLARDLTLQRDVVLKTLPTSGLDAGARRALLAEARLAGGIKHPNVVPVLDVRDTGADAVLILEYVEGGSLRGLLERRGALPPREAVAIFRGVLAGLRAAHEHGIVHRDVKPENVLLTKDGVPKLADFGAARDTRPGATAMPQTGGTLAYMSPEQVRGVGVDARSDLYGACAMLVEMLTSRPYLPLAGADQFQARAMILERAPELDLPREALALSGFLLKGLAKAPAERYASATDTLMALDATSA